MLFGGCVAKGASRTGGRLRDLPFAGRSSSDTVGSGPQRKTRGQADIVTGHAAANSIVVAPYAMEPHHAIFDQALEATPRGPLSLAELMRALGLDCAASVLARPAIATQRKAEADW